MATRPVVPLRKIMRHRKQTLLFVTISPYASNTAAVRMAQGNSIRSLAGFGLIRLIVVGEETKPVEFGLCMGAQDGMVLRTPDTNLFRTPFVSALFRQAREAMLQVGTIVFCSSHFRFLKYDLS